MRDLLKDKTLLNVKTGKSMTRSLTRGAVAALCLSVLAMPLGKSDIDGNRITAGKVVASTLLPAAHAAGYEVSIYPSIAKLKLEAGEYNGPIATQVWLGDIYSGNLSRQVDGLAIFEHPKRMSAHFKDELYDSVQRNRIEAYFWYSLAAAQFSFHDQLSHIDPASQPLIRPERDYAEYAWGRMQTLKKTTWRNKIVGPSFWTAEKLFVDVYRKGGKRAHYLMGKFYKGINTDFVVRSNYDAYVWMMASEAHNFMDAGAVADDFQSDILYSQELLAELAAKRIVAYSMAVAANRTSSFGGAMVSSQGGRRASSSNFAPSNGRSNLMPGGSAPAASTRHKVLNDNSSNAQVNWGSDFQANRRGQSSGNVRMGSPDGVDSHHSSRSAFDMGNGYLAAGNVKDAKTYFEYAIALEPYSRSAIDASRQLQALTMTCSLRDDRVVRMSSAGNRDKVHDIPWDRLQLALKALGYYTSYVDGEPGQETRRAVRDFQRGELNVDDTGYLTTDQRVELICLAAQNVRDAESQIQLGIMYAHGIGLNCNTAAARAWFQKAADQGHPAALFNLGLMYTQGFYDRHVPGQYPYSSEENPVPPRRIIDPDVAKFFFSEAGDRGHPGTKEMIAYSNKLAKNSKTAKLPHGVVGCIDYEVEVAMEQYQNQIVSLSSSIKKTPDNACSELRGHHKTLKSLSGNANRLWDEVEGYEQRMGQSNGEFVNRMTIAQAKGVLKNTNKLLVNKLSECSSGA